MKTILVFVSSLDGKVTKWGDPFVKKWVSKQDHEYFNKIWNDAPVVILGSKTFDAEPIKANSKHLLVIMAINPEKYKKYEVIGQLEFTNESPMELTKRFKKEACKLLLVAGGAHVATSFIKEQLVDEVWLTIEPKIFGSGGNFVIEEKLDINLKLISCDRINKQGTLFTKYKVIKKRKIKL